MTTSLTTRRLTRQFADITAVDGLDLELYSGQIFGLLGPNAAGKSTTLRMLTGIIRPTQGTATLLGYDLVSEINAIRPRVGYVAQHFGLYPELTVFENLAFYSSLYQPLDESRRFRLLEQYKLDGYADRYAGHLSGGYKRRLSIACAVSHDPELIFLDEPTAGIDPITRKELWDLFYDMAAAGKTLFVTTHYMEEAERCHRLAFLSQGCRVAYGTPKEIKGMMQDMRVYSFTAPHDPRMAAAIMQLDGVRLINRIGLEVRLIADQGLSPAQLEEFLLGWQGASRPAEAMTTLEDVFVTLTG